ncbi:MAG TPA: hypothetical protein VHR55_12685 [Candidatus Limnocylindria bacterium]|nr:hypothetical protein [Candidatus Limnocylindria bacterium]
MDSDGQKQETSPRKLTLSLLENAYDSLNDSLESADYAEAADEQARKWKLAIFLLVHALELLMKERLRREHHLLVFSSVDKRGHTVSMEVALGRLQAVGVAIEPADQASIRTAIGWRDRIAHYELDLSLDEASKVYAGLFEFAHSFHRSELGGDLHDHIREENWWKEAALMEVFREEFVSYNGMDVIKTWPAELLAAQDFLDVEIEHQKYPRLPYGVEIGWEEVAEKGPCHDCSARKGQLHVPGCDVEQCPRCQGQMISCPCKVTEKFADDEEQEVEEFDPTAD